MSTKRLEKAAAYLQNILAESISAGEIDAGSPEEQQIKNVIDGLKNCERKDLDQAVWSNVIALTSSLKGYGLDCALMLTEENF